jgi:hypothetical protein
MTPTYVELAFKVNTAELVDWYKDHGSDDLSAEDFEVDSYSMEWDFVEYEVHRTDQRFGAEPEVRATTSLTGFHTRTVMDIFHDYILSLEDELGAAFHGNLCSYVKSVEPTDDGFIIRYKAPELSRLETAEASKARIEDQLATDRRIKAEAEAAAKAVAHLSNLVKATRARWMEAGLHQLVEAANLLNDLVVNEHRGYQSQADNLIGAIDDKLTRLESAGAERAAAEVAVRSMA